MGQVRGFVDYPVRECAEITADLGAIACCLKLIDRADPDPSKSKSEFANFRFVMPSGHEMMSEMKVVLKLIREYGYDKLAPGYGFSSPKQIDILFGGYDTYVCLDFIQEVCRPIMTDKLVEAWMETKPRDLNSFDEFLLWVENCQQEDVTFKCHAFLLLDVFSALALIQKGIRMNKKAQHEAGRKTVLPFMGLLNHIDYFKVTFHCVLQ